MVSLYATVKTTPIVTTMYATLSNKGQVTFPKKIREQLKLKTGDRLEFQLLNDGELRVSMVKAHISDLKGILPKPKKAVSLEEMDAAIAEGSRR